MKVVITIAPKVPFVRGEGVHGWLNEVERLLQYQGNPKVRITVIPATYVQNGPDVEVEILSSVDEHKLQEIRASFDTFQEFVPSSLKLTLLVSCRS